MVKFSLAALAVLASGALGSPIDALIQKRDCNGDNCLRGFRGNPVPAEGFCSSALSREPITSTAYNTEYATVTSTQTDFATTSVTEIISTLTTVITVHPAGIDKREVPATAVSKFIKNCGSDASRISSQCSCFLALSPTPTVWTTLPTTITTTLPTTITEISTSTIPDTLTVTSTSTSAPAFTPIIVNGHFDLFPAESGNISPWTLKITPGLSTGTLLPTDDLSGSGSAPNMFFADCIGGDDDPYAKVTLSQKLHTEVGKTYRLSFRYKVLAGRQALTYIVIWIDGEEFFDFNNGETEWADASATFVAGSVNPPLDVTLLAAGWGSTKVWVDSMDVVEVV